MSNFFSNRPFVWHVVLHHAYIHFFIRFRDSIRETCHILRKSHTHFCEFSHQNLWILKRILYRQLKIVNSVLMNPILIIPNIKIQFNHWYAHIRTNFVLYSWMSKYKEAKIESDMRLKLYFNNPDCIPNLKYYSNINTVWQVFSFIFKSLSRSLTEQLLIRDKIKSLYNFLNDRDQWKITFFSTCQKFF